MIFLHFTGLAYKENIYLLYQGGDETSYSVNCNNIGNVVFKVWLKDEPSIYTNVRISVAHGISPPQPIIALGSTACLTTAGAMATTGVWSVDNDKVLAVDKSTGGVVALTTGSTVVRFVTSTGELKHL